ncbi:MAG: DUF1549 domain-containing protein, partial [Phycisphaerae bacterium]|nr:DUF1549 domain-containing protein [Phycisphaerae bacterium]
MRRVDSTPRKAAPVLAWIALLPGVTLAQATAAIDFDRDIQPILAEHCIKCHGPEKRKGGLRLDSPAALVGGDSGKVIRPRDSRNSLLVQMVMGTVADDPEAVMPAKGPRLSNQQIGLLTRWIDQGAIWPQKTGTEAVRSSHWSLKPLSRPAVPDRVPGQAVDHVIDRFTGAKLKAAGLAFTSQASRPALIRRLSFDLTGLPPTPRQIKAFVEDTRPDAYGKLVNRLLESRHYGERWARHWLDVVRFGESHGFEYNQPRNNAWHYRNWVIDALNEDMPYDQFVRLQLAGDVWPDADPADTVATGFLVAGPHNTTLPSSQNMRKTMQQDEYEDLVGTIGQTFLGLTVNCARCHSHKFDPITQREYYGFVATVAGVQHGDRDVPTRLQRDAEQRAAALGRKRRALVSELDRIEQAARERVLAARKKGTVPKPPPPRAVGRWEFEGDLRDSIGSAHGHAIGGARVENGELVVDGRQAWVKTDPLPFALREKTLEAWVKLSTLDQGGGGVIGVETPGGGIFDSIVYAEREKRRWMAGSNGFARYAPFKAPEETDAAKRFVHVAIVCEADGRIIGYRDGKPYGSAYRKTGLQGYAAGKSVMVFGIRHEPAGGNRMLSGRIGRAALYDRALTAEEVALSAGAAGDYVSEKQLLAELSQEKRARREALRTQILTVEREREKLKPTKRIKAYAVKPRNPGAMRVLRRGNVTDPGDVVVPAGLSAVPGVDSNFGLKENASDADRRRQLAQWIASNDNPIFARVIANRLWHYHFGTGIVDTPSDFGVNGGRPSHPQLLEWLAVEIIARGWSLKQMHRLMVTSATYRQGTTSNPAAMKVDADNRLIWRMSPRRLEAEALRDTILAVSGQLNPAYGGVGYRDVREYKYKGSHFYDPIEATGPAVNLRTVYRFSPRGAK